MLNHFRISVGICVFVNLLFLSSCIGDNESTRREIDFNFDWSFYLGDHDPNEWSSFDYSDWRNIRLPHDWSVEHSFTQEKAGGATAFLPGGIGWYVKQFKLPLASKDKLTWIEFDGIYTNSEVWINGQYLGKRPFGYAPYSYDLTPYLKFGSDENIILVKADRSAYLDSRWYPGSGIYRNVKLVTANNVHIPQWGSFITTPEVNAEKALVNIETSVKNQSNSVAKGQLQSTIYFNENEVGECKADFIAEGGEQLSVNTELAIAKPQLWDIESPNMYNCITKVVIDGQVVDTYATRFGIRSFEFDVNNGFFLNGKNTLIKGVCIHHDGGLVGAAVPKGVWKRRLQKLKAAGCNAIRTAHNPPSEEFLDLCDEMGFLVQDEAFDEFQNPKDKRRNYNQQSEDDATKGYTHHFDEWAERDIKNLVLRDRNHPSIIMWSIGNEIEWTFPYYGNAAGYWGGGKGEDVNYYWDEPPYQPKEIEQRFYADNKEDILVKTAQNLSAWVKELDTTRPVTANLVIPSVSNFSGYADALDIVGLSYRRAVYDYCHRNYPTKVFLGTENWTRYHDWKPVEELDYISGIFVWTGIDYMGESRAWGKRGSNSGLLDFAGFKKPSYYLFKSLWNDEPELYINTQIIEKSPYKLEGEFLVEKEKDWADHQKWGWQDVNEHWNYADGDSIAVEVYTNQPEVELWLNNTSYGIRKLADVSDHILKWMVPYQSGKLEAKSINGAISTNIQSAGEPQTIRIVAEENKLKANAYDVLHVVAQLYDADGMPVKHIEKEIEFVIEGPAKLLGVDNGNVYSMQDYQSTKLHSSEGHALLIIQSLKRSGEVRIKAISNGMESNDIIIESNI